MIELVDVGCRQGSFTLQGINLQIHSGEYCVLMGRTGRGKTTLLELICGLRRVSSGTIRLNDRDVTSWAPGDRLIGYVPQDLALFTHLNVREHLSFALKLRRRPQPEINDRVEELADWLGLEPLLKRSVAGLSGGESQRVALGRAIAIKPTILLLDEPLSALDVATRQEMHRLLIQLKTQTGMTTLHVTHNPEEAAALADRTLVLDAGRIEELTKP